MDSNVVSQIMSQIPSKNRAYSLKQGLALGDECLSLVLDARIHAFIPEEIFELKHLIALSIKGIPVRNLPDEIGQLSQLKILNLLDCGVQELPSSIIHLPLEVLWLSEGEWNEIPELIFQLQSIKSLVINNYGLKSLNPLIGQCSLLEEVSFSSNQLKNIPAVFYDSIYLKILDFSNNKISKWDNAIEKCRDLRKINFSNNLLPSIPDFTGELSRLNHLNVSKNKIINIPSSISKCHLLSYLDLSNNQITETPDNFYSLPISYLDISKNKLEIIDESISNCRRLRTFNISNNKLIKIPLAINQLKQLEYFNFSKNDLIQFPEGILGLDNIKKIKGWNNLLFTDERKHIIPFIQSCRKNNIGFNERVSLFNNFKIIHQLNKKELVHLINSNYRPFKIKASEKLIQDISLIEINNILFIGKTRRNKTAYYSQLVQQGINISSNLSKDTSHILLGNGKYKTQIDSNWNGVFINEEKLASLLLIEDKQENFIFPKTAIDNIKNLLLSSENNQELALQLLNGKLIPDELITVIYFIIISSNNSSFRIKARNLIKYRLSENILKYSKKDFEKENRINSILNEFKQIDLIQLKELSYLLFNKENKSWLFIYNNYDSFIFNQFKTKDLDLSNAGFHEIPEEVKLIKNKSSINLSKNELKEITNSDISYLYQFSKIDLSYNPLISIPYELFQFPQLRILNLKGCPQIDVSKKSSWITIFK